jgi:ABC-type transporter Mla subunit MlaD
MSEGAFRWVIALSVSLCWVTTLVMAWSMFQVSRAVKRLEGKIGPVADKAGPILDSAQAMIDDARPKIQDLIARADEIAVSARDQMARLESLVTDATDRARLQIERIDIAVGDTMNRVQETTAAVQSTILKPVREVNGVVSGLRAAISTLARGNRASVDHATQDEEMFI